MEIAKVSEGEVGVPKKLDFAYKKPFFGSIDTFRLPIKSFVILASRSAYS